MRGARGAAVVIYCKPPIKKADAPVAHHPQQTHRKKRSHEKQEEKESPISNLHLCPSVFIRGSKLFLLLPYIQRVLPYRLLAARLWSFPSVSREHSNTRRV